MIKMLKSVEKLVQAARYGKKKATYGNHSMEQVEKYIFYYYHNNCVCKVDKTTGKAVFDTCGYDGYSSTTRTINSYKEVY